VKRFKLEQSNADIISHSGLALVGQAINNIESEFYLIRSMAVKEIPCEATPAHG